MPPDIANDMTLIRLGATVDAAAMSSLSRTAIIERPMPVRRSRATTSVVDDEHARSTGSTGCAGWRSRCGRSPAARCAAWWCRTRDPVNSGRRNSQFEHITANASVITARNRPRTRSAGMPMMIAAKTPTRIEQTTAGNHAIWNRHVPEVERHRDVETGAEHDHRQRAEPDERELAERQLPGPTRERRDRRRDQRVDHDLGPEELLRLLVQEQREDREEAEQHGEAEQRAGGARTRATAAVPGSASPGPTATSRCRRGGCARRTSRARARRRTGRGRRPTGSARSTLASTMRSNTPTAIPPTMHIGSECMRAMSATTSARSSSDGPDRDARPPRRCCRA